MAKIADVYNDVDLVSCLPYALSRSLPRLFYVKKKRGRVVEGRVLGQFGFLLEEAIYVSHKPTLFLLLQVGDILLLGLKVISVPSHPIKLLVLC